MNAAIAIRHFAFLIPGNFAEDDPLTGLERTLDIIALGERLGFHSAWIRQRHLERGVSSAAVFLSAATQRTKTIELGTAVIQLGYENLFRLAEDLATVDVLSRGRLNIGVSTGKPPFAPLLGDLLHDGDPAAVDYSHIRAERLARALSSEPLHADAVAGNAAGAQIPRLQPIARGLTERLWYGGGSQRSAAWSGKAGFNLLTGNIVTAEVSDDFLVSQARLIEIFRANWAAERPARVALGRVILPIDSADAATRRRYADFARARHARTLAPQGERKTLFLPDIVGSSDEIIEALSRDPVLPHVDELRLELPYEFLPEDYEQVITDFATKVAPAIAAGDGRPAAYPAASAAGGDAGLNLDDLTGAVRSPHEDHHP